MAGGYCQARVTCSLPLRSSAMSALLITGDSRAVNKSSSCGPPCNHSTSMCVKHLVTLLGLLAFSSAITCSVHCYYNDIILYYPSSTVYRLKLWIISSYSVANQLQLTCNTATHTTKETKLLTGFHTEGGGSWDFPPPAKISPPRNLNINDVIIKMYDFFLEKVYRRVRVILCTQKTLHLR